MADESKNKRFRNEPRSTLSCYALRLKPGQEVRECLLKYVRDKKLEAPFVLSCVGSVTQVTLRLANASKDTPNEVGIRHHDMHSPVISVGLLMHLRETCRLNHQMHSQRAGSFSHVARVEENDSRAHSSRFLLNTVNLNDFRVALCLNGYTISFSSPTRTVIRPKTYV